MAGRADKHDQQTQTNKQTNSIYTSIIMNTHEIWRYMTAGSMAVTLPVGHKAETLFA